jgi:hypothetical protein
MHILNTIIPIFAVVALGGWARRMRYIPTEFLAPANRLVYHLAIPAMIFRAISKGTFSARFDIRVILITLITVLVMFVAAWCVGRLLRFRGGSLATFVQNAIHGNLGYIGLAVAFYYLGEQGLVRASIIAGFLIILQNFLAVCILQVHSQTSSLQQNLWNVLWKIAVNPIIISAVAGILFSAFQWPVPVIIGRSLDILGDLALPTALLIIGATLSFDLMRSEFFAVIWSGVLKLIVLPLVGWSIFRFIGIDAALYLPGLILLASPTATVTYVMAREMQGDTDFAVAAISFSTLLSAVTFFIWLNIAG